MKLPVAISVPHAGLEVPAELAERCLLSEEQIVADGDGGAREIYAIEDEVAFFLTTPVARAVVDLNRPVDDRGADGVVKTQTVQGVPIWRDPLDEESVGRLLERHYHPYHAALSRQATACPIGIDCHTMLAIGPEIGPMAGLERPALCLSNDHGRTCPDDWFRSLARRLEAAFGKPVALNHPFRGGYITRHHGTEMPWVQLELSRADFAPLDEKRARLLEAIRAFCREDLPPKTKRRR